MHSDVATGTPTVPRAGLVWFGLIELACIAGFMVSLAQGRTSVAWTFMVGPLQFLAWMVLIGDDFHVLLYCAFTFPLAIVAFLPYPYVRYALYPGAIAVLVLSRLVWTMRTRRNGHPRLERSERTPARVLLFMLFFSFACAVSRGWGNKHMLTYTVFALETFVMAYFWATVPRSERHIRAILIVSAAAVALMASSLPLLEGSSHVGTFGFGGSKVLTGPFGVFDLNTFGGVVAIFAAILTALAFRAKRLATRLVLIVVVVILLVALVATRSRGAWLGFGAALLYVVVRARSLWSTVVIAGAAMLLLTSDVLRHTVTARLAQTSAEDASLAGRAILWSCALGMARAHWLTGVGMENFRVLKVHYGFPNLGMAEVMRYNAHNVYLEMLADLGIVGLVSFLWLLLGTFLRSDGVARARKDDGAGLAVALNAGLIVFAVHGLWDCLTLLFMVPGMLFGLAMCLHRLESERAGVAVP